MWTLMRRLWYGAAAPVGLAGLLATPLHMRPVEALILAVFAAVSGMAVVRSARGRAGRPAPGMRLPVVGLLCGATAVVAAGLTLEVGATALVLVVGLAIAGWLVHRPKPAAEHTTSPAGVRPPAAAAPLVEPRLAHSDRGLLEVDVQPISEMSTPELCLAWRRSYVVLTSPARTPAERAAVVELRRRCLDELERRNPSGFARWVTTARAAGDPGRFIPSQQQS